MDSMNGPSIRFSFMFLLWLIVLRKKHVLLHTFWVEPRQETPSNYVVRIVWITIEEMHLGSVGSFTKWISKHLRTWFGSWHLTLTLNVWIKFNPN